MFVQKEERPTVLRSNIVEKYLHQVLNKKKDPVIYDKKYQIVKKMHEYGMDNRVLNNMRQSMNEQIEDEMGLMKTQDFRKMFYTFYRSISQDKKATIF